MRMGPAQQLQVLALITAAQRRVYVRLELFCLLFIATACISTMYYGVVIDSMDVDS